MSMYKQGMLPGIPGIIRHKDLRCSCHDTGMSGCETIAGPAVRLDAMVPGTSERGKTSGVQELDHRVSYFGEESGRSSLSRGEAGCCQRDT